MTAEQLEEQLKYLLENLRQVTREQKDYADALDDSPIFEWYEACGLTGVWGHFYELPFAHHIGALYEISGLDGYARQMTKETYFDISRQMVEDAQDAEFFGYLADSTVYELSAMAALAKSCDLSLECISIYSVPLNRLVERVRGGSDEAFFQAITIDPGSVFAPSMARRLHFAMMRKEMAFLSRYRRSLDGPREDRKPYRDLRLVLRALEDCTAFQRLSRKQIHDVVVIKLKLYGSPYSDSLKNLFSRFDDWRQESTR